MTAKRLTTDAMYLGAALMLAFLESLLPPLPVPGLKLGLANLAVLCCTYGVGLADGGTVAFARCLLTGLLFGGGTSLLFSVSGTAAVFLMLCLLRLTDGLLRGRLSFIGISVLTAAAHHLGQLFCAGLLYGWGLEILSVYGGGLLLAGTVCGAVTGWTANLLFRRLGSRSMNGSLCTVRHTESNKR
ncbi:MAG: Gx transporter family protein [Clostridia bacterium]|nr:Gx transporter family protein [Clostridia bacterium]